MELLGGIAGGLVLGFVLGYLMATFSFSTKAGGKQQLELGFAIAKKAGADPAFAKKAEELLNPPPPVPPKPSGEPIRLLAQLQRESRLLDFLMENMQAYSDDQIGASVRDIHQKAQAVLKKHLTLEPVLPQEEGSTVTVPTGFDPSAIRLVGNVTGQPPFKGTLAHSGWKVKKVDLPKPAEGQDEFVLMPAEVEIA